jgi:hypothetical protein
MSYFMDVLLFVFGVWVGIAFMCLLMMARRADEDQ